MIQRKSALLFLIVGLLSLTGILRADDAAPAAAITPTDTTVAQPAATSAPAPVKPMTVKEAMKAAGELAAAGKTDDAIAAYEKIGPLPSKKGESWRLNSEGFAYLEAPTPMPDKAVPVLEKAVAADADNAFAWNNLGSAYEQTDDLKKAEDAYQKSIDAAKAAGLDSDKAEANLAEVQTKLGDTTPKNDAKPDVAADSAASTTPTDSTTPAAGADASK